MRGKVVTMVTNVELPGNIIGGLINAWSDNDETFAEHVKYLRTNEISAGKNAIVAMADLHVSKVWVHAAYMDPQMISDMMTSCLMTSFLMNPYS